LREGREREKKWERKGREGREEEKVGREVEFLYTSNSTIFFYHCQNIFTEIFSGIARFSLR